MSNVNHQSLSSIIETAATAINDIIGVIIIIVGGGVVVNDTIMLLP